MLSFAKHDISGSEYYDPTMMEEKKRKRMLSNRESAKRSRMKRRQHVEDLTNQINRFMCSKNDMLAKINAVSQLHAEVETENRILMAEIGQLRNRLEGLEVVLVYSGYGLKNMNGGGSVDFGQLTLLKAWREITNQAMPPPLMASTSAPMLQM